MAAAQVMPEEHYGFRLTPEQRPCSANGSATRVGRGLSECGYSAASQNEDSFQNGGPLAHRNMARERLQAGGRGFWVTL